MEPEGEPSSSGLTAGSLEKMNVAQLKALAEEVGYTLSKTRKADMIAEILEQQEGKA